MRKFWIGYWFKNWYFAYKIAYAIVIIGSRTYFKKFKYQGKEKIPKNAGIIYAVNHQNAFLDAIVIATQTDAPLNFLARADIFKKKIANKILRNFYMLPVYRQRDGVNTIEKNKITFDDCHEILNQKGNLVIFPEGNHNYKKTLRPLKKGLARIALGTLSKFGKETPLYIIPLGIDYESHFKMNSDILLNVGEPINVSDHYSKFIENSVDAINKLTLKIAEDLESLIINIQDIENYDELYYLLHGFPFLEKNQDPKRKFDLRKEKLIKAESLCTQNPEDYKNIITDVKIVKSFMSKHEIKPYLINKPPSSYLVLVVLSLILLLLSPFHLIGLVTNYIPYKIPVWFVENKIKDKHFHASLKQAMGVLLFIFYWLLITLSITIFKDWSYGIIFLLIAPIIAMVNFRYWIILIKVKARWNYKSASKNDEFERTKEAFDRVQKKFS
jgi:1-acyl-sn-glycerol-3-phosphate acyltransferase